MKPLIITLIISLFIYALYIILKIYNLKRKSKKLQVQYKEMGGVVKVEEISKEKLMADEISTVKRQSDIDSSLTVNGNFDKSIYKYICYIIFMPIYYYCFRAHFNGVFENLYDVSNPNGRGADLVLAFVDLFKFLHIPEYIGNPVLSIFFGIFITSFVTMIAAIFLVTILTAILNILEKFKQ